MNDRDLRDLVDYPRETLGVELKEWVNLEDALTKAKLARHIAALANFGGGYIVFGFCDDATPAPSRPSDLQPYNHDTISAIVKKYLVPTMHCDLTVVEATSGATYPIVRVPSHGSTPICAKASGPHDKNGKPQGILQGTYYLRLPGPESAPIVAADQWHSIIRRCVLAERGFIIDALSDLTEPGRGQPETDVLRDFHANTRERFRHAVQRSKTLSWPVSLTDNYYQMSYRIVSTESNEISPQRFIGVLNSVNNELRDIVWTGWSMFYPFSRAEIRPAIEPQMVAGEDLDVYVTSLINEQTSNTTMPDYWRMTRTGIASLIRGYREDRNRQKDGPQKGFSPYLLARELTEFLGHALTTAKHLRDVTRIEFTGSWHGLSQRQLIGRDGTTWDYDGQQATADGRTISGAWPVPHLRGEWLDIIAKLSNRILILFDGFEITDGQVNCMATTFRTT